MTEVESVPKTKLDIVEDENHVANSCEHVKEHVEVQNHTAEGEENGDLSENTSQKEVNRSDPVEAPPPPKNPWTRHLKSNGEKGTHKKLFFFFDCCIKQLFLSHCVYISFRRSNKTNRCKSRKAKGQGRKLRGYGVR